MAGTLPRWPDKPYGQHHFTVSTEEVAEHRSKGVSMKPLLLQNY
jgi:hypothetical protein